MSMRSCARFATVRSFHASTATAAKLSVADLPAGDLKGKLVFVRSDLNVPMKEGKIKDDTRIRESVPTLDLLTKAGARVILTSHLGRPTGVTKGLELDAVAANLQSHMSSTKVKKINTVIGSEAEAAVKGIKGGEILLLENVRFHPEEEKNKEPFAKALAYNADIYVNDAFGAAHRAHASTAGVAKFIKRRVAGVLMAKELRFLNDAVLAHPARPLAAVIGGSKVSTKVTVIGTLLTKVDKLFIGGAMMFTFYKAMGLEVGKSLVELDQLDVARDIMRKSEERKVKVFLPTDVVVGSSPDAKDAATVKTVSYKNIPADLGGYDIGPQTLKEFKAGLDGVKTVVWNGPFGVFENPLFANGTNTFAKYLAELTPKGVTTVVGGGETVSAVTKLKLAKSMTHVSTGGGASLELLEGRELPGVACLEDAK